MFEFLKGPFLGLIFSYYILMTFSTMLSVTLLSTLIILLCTLKLNLTCETLWTEAGSGLLISMLKRLSLVRLTSVITLSLLMRKWICLLKKTHFKYAGVALLLLIGLSLLIVSIAETTFIKIWSLG